MSIRLCRLGAIIAVMAAIAACGPPKPRDVAIELRWNTNGVQIADGRGVLATDVGYTIELDRFEVTTYSFELLPCEQAPPRPPQQSSFSLIGTAWAGHRRDHPPTLTGKSRVESPLRRTSLALETLHIPDVAYCSGHYLIARLPENGIDPADAASVDISLRAHGRYRKGGDGAWTEFTVETPVSHGILVDLKQEGAGKGVRFGNGDTLTVMHRLDTTFNGVDFATMNQPAIARQILRQIVAGTELIHSGGGAAG